MLQAIVADWRCRLATPLEHSGNKPYGPVKEAQWLFGRQHSTSLHHWLWQSHETAWLFKRKEKKYSKNLVLLVLKKSALLKSSVNKGSHLNMTVRNTVKLKPSTYTKITFVNQEIVAFLSVSGWVRWPLTYHQLCPQHCPALIRSISCSSTVMTRYQASRHRQGNDDGFLHATNFSLQRNYPL